MALTPENLRYSPEDEWVKLDGDVATIGITDYAQDLLSDIVYLEPPAAQASAGDIFRRVVESVNAASDLFPGLRRSCRCSQRRPWSTRPKPSTKTCTKPPG
ncbi:MAG: hypothetical protein R2838_20175 [Caldilineaceae bacterium]